MNWNYLARKINRLKWIILLMALAGSIAAPQAGLAQTNQALLYQDDFNSGQARGWQLQTDNQGAWNVTNGKLFAASASSDRPAVAQYQPAVFGDSALFFTFNPVDIQGNFQVILREDRDAGSAYRFTFSRSGPIFLQVEREIKGEWTALANILQNVRYDPATNQSAIEWTDTSEYSAAIAVLQSRVTVQLSPVISLYKTLTPLAFEAFDKEPIGDGYLSFVSTEKGMALDNLRITGDPPAATYFVRGRLIQIPAQAPVAAGSAALVASDSADPTSGSQVDQADVSADGTFALSAHPGSPFYTVREILPEGYNALRSAMAGAKITGQGKDFVQFSGPLWTSLPAQVSFYVSVPTPAPGITPSPTETLSPTDTPTPTAAPAVVEVSTPTDTPEPAPAAESGGGTGLPLVGIGLGALAVLAVAVLGGWLLIRLLSRPGRPGGPANQPQPRPPENPLPPGIPPIRRLRVWFSQTAPAGGQNLLDSDILQVGAPYNLNAMVQVQGAQAAAQAGRTRLLRVMFFAPEQDLQYNRAPEDMTLSAFGPSTLASKVVIPLRGGPLRVRACVYFGNVLLQSTVVEFSVAKTAAKGAPGSIREGTDYQASVNLASLGRFQQPTLSIFTNQAANGAQWIGVYAANQTPTPSLPSGLLRTFDPASLANMAQQIRDVLENMQVVRTRSGGLAYHYEANLPLAERLDRMEQDLVALAKCSWPVFDNLFLSYASEEDLSRLPVPGQAGIISIANCHSGASLPWAALYDLPLDLDAGQPLRLCPIIKAQMAAAGSAAGPRKPVLEDGAPCHQRPDCPLKDAATRGCTVCPYGFWGFAHQIEQPVQAQSLMQTAPPDPAILNQSSEMIPAPGAAPQIALGLHPDIAEAGQHVQELRELATSSGFEMAVSQDRTQVLNQLTDNEYLMYYFYCHGEISNQEFKLVFGPAGQKTYIAASSLDPRQTHWQKDHHPLVILNGCETVKLTPDVIRGFLGKFKSMGAAGVIGSEIPIHTHLAMPFGSQLVWRVLHGASVGEAFLSIRRAFLEQGNPMALVYTCYTPAGLHVHKDPCAWCEAHINTRG